MNKSFTASLLWDRFGIGISGICAIHCLLVPVFVSVLPLWPAAATVHGWLHPVFIVLIIPTVWFAARRSHFDKKITFRLVSGFFLVLAGWLAGHFWLGYRAEIVLTLLGSLVLIAGHWSNYRHHRHCNNSRHRHHPVAEQAAGKAEVENGGEEI